MINKQMLYIYVSSDAPYAYGRDLDNERRIDYAPDGTPRGIEITCVSHGVNLDDLPRSVEIGHLLKNRNIKIYA